MHTLYISLVFTVCCKYFVSTGKVLKDNWIIRAAVYDYFYYLPIIFSVSYLFFKTSDHPFLSEVTT